MPLEDRKEMMNVTLTREAKFDAAHFLPEHRSDCKNLHGHTWLLALSVTGPIQPLDGKAEQGMVLDMGCLKSILKFVVGGLDHKTLNDVLEYPTTERVLEYIAKEAKSYEDCLPQGCFVSRVTLSEQPLTPRFWAEVVFTGRGMV